MNERIVDRPAALCRRMMAASVTMTTVVVAFVAAPVAAAPYIAAQTHVCKGFFGSVDSPRLNCVDGDAGGGGAVVIGGSGVGSGINIPIQSPGGGNLFGASAGALQDYGIFRGFANLHLIEQGPGIFGGVYSAFAAGQFQDIWTITGGTGQGMLHLAFTVTGSASGTGVVVGGNGSEGINSGLAISVSLNGRFAGAVGDIERGGTYEPFVNGPDAFNFTFGEPFVLDVLNVINSGGGFDRFDPPDFFQLDVVASFEHTSRLTGITVTDRFGNPIPDITLTAQSGTRYPLAADDDPVAIPEPATLAMLGLGFAGLGFHRNRRRRI